MNRDPINDVRTKIELTPDEGLPALQRAFDRVKERRSTQYQILADTNAAFAEVGLEPMTISAFNRWVLRIRAGNVRRPVLPLAGLSADKQSLRKQAEELRHTAAKLNEIANALAREAE